MKKSILFLIMLLILSTNLYAEELHYHKNMWCLKPDGTPNGMTENDNGVIWIFDLEGGSSKDEYLTQSLQAAFKDNAVYYGIPAQIPSKETEYDSEKISGTVVVDPVSPNQIYMSTWQEGGENQILMTYNPATKTTRVTTCMALP